MLILSVVKYIFIPFNLDYHCVNSYDFYFRQSVTLGIHNDTLSRICTAEFCIDPSRNVLVLPAIVHPNYDSYTKHNDIAVIPLKEKVQFTDYIKAICLSRTTTNASQFTVSGWGRTESGFNSKVKLKVDIPKANRTLCEQQYRTLGILISDKQVCAGGERGNDACTGDSGGPLMAMNDLGTAWYAEGIVSIGPSNCGTEGWPGVYTYIPKYYDWIIEQIKNNIKTYNVGFSSTTKLKVVVPRVNRAFCEQRYRIVGQSLTDRQLCAGGEQGYSACTGDSGGPLMAMTNDDTWYAEGIVSFGATRCGTENWPSVYTSIPKYYNWVLEQINNTLKMYNVDNYY
ncbi:hypothetical protein MML48_6g00015870 [Holotrichia oblita]|uniref:Uncharacterized protein n=1 Tax=Holotrichia oblita TaxID=644536 RepID=A0ACB9SXC1_HOLOL|nr:hypothetical protein MML48_6g00015870 [Holotrichia oblita]